MKKQLIAILVGGIILFIWQFLTWSLLNVHGNETKYTPNQARIMETLSQNLPEAGSYMLPQPPPGSSQAEKQAFMENASSTPWASIVYHKNFNTNMGMNMLRGILVDWLAVFLLVWLLLKFANLDFKTVLLTSLAVGIIGYLTISYLYTIWFDTSSIGQLIDTFVQWGLTGTWLGWWLTRKRVGPINGEG